MTPRNIKPIPVRDLDKFSFTFQEWIRNVTNLLYSPPGLIPVISGGTGLTAGTSGGILGFTGTGVIASSVLLTNHALVLGGGVGATPTPMGSLGTSTTVLHGNAGGAPSFGAVSLTADVSGVLPFTNGGFGVGSASVGDLFYANGTTSIASLALGTAGKILQSNGTIPSYTSFKLPTSVGATGTLLRSNGTDYVASTPTYPNSATANKLLVGDGTNIVLSTPTYPNSSTANKALVGDGTNIVLSTPTIPLTSSPSSGKVMIGDGTNWVASTPTYPNAAPANGTFLRGDGTNFVTSTLTVTSGTYTPTLTGITNIAGSIIYDAQWMQVNNVITVSGMVDISPTLFATTQTTFALSFPVASTITAENQCSGTFNAQDTIQGGAVTGQVANHRAFFSFMATVTGFSRYNYTYTYSVI